MAHYALIDDDNIVIQVIVAEQDFIDSGAVGDPAKWIQTSYNTYGGRHRTNGVPLRKNFAGIGFTYNAAVDAFIPPKPYQSWTLNSVTFLWEPPVPFPDDGQYYIWNEETLAWESRA